MAETCRFGNNIEKQNTTSNQDENFCIFNVLCVFISLVTILADLTTDILVFAEYCKDGHLYWGLGTFIFIFTPNVLISAFSLRWIIIDRKTSLQHWITHGFLVGFLERYILFLHEALVCKNLESSKTHNLVSQRNDLNLLHFLYVFTGTVPQIILQSYAIIILDENYYTKAFALTASIASVLWGCSTYIYSIVTNSSEHSRWKSLLLKLVWHFSILVGRIPAILLFTLIFGIWTLVPLGLHWSAMTFWIVIQKTTFCPNKCEETLYNVVMGFVYCFCYINLREGHTRYRIMLFYTLIVTQNFGSLFLYVLISDTERQKKLWSITATVFIIIGTLIGICAMILYYRYFHSTGPILWKNTAVDIELNNKVVFPNLNTCRKDASSLSHIRSFKTLQKAPSNNSESSKEISSQDQMQKKENETADKKNLLDHWVAKSVSPTLTLAPHGNSMDASSIEIYTVENTPLQTTQKDDPGHNISTKINSLSNKKKAVCFPTKLALKLASLENLESSIDEITSSHLNLQKRRGICSSDELRNDFTNLNLDICNSEIRNFENIIKTDHSSEISHDTDGSNKKTSSDSIDMDLDLSFSDINSSDINNFNENIVQKLCLSALKNIKVGNQDADIENIQRIALDILKEMYAKKGKNRNSASGPMNGKQRDLDTPTEILSVHDYENICAVNIAREAWGLRSWNGYSDIENCLHDGSVVRDRRRDTLTSGSSEISSCISQDLKNAILCASPFPKKVHTYSNVFVKFDRTNQEDYMNTLVSQEDAFLTKPCNFDIKDLSHLEPIMEELDDLGDVDPTVKKRLNSESSLVATIDEIRKSTVNNSPRNVYHRREHLWDSPQFNTTKGIDPTLKRALWKEVKFDSTNIMDPLPKTDDFLNSSQERKYEMHKKELNIKGSPTSIDMNTYYRSCPRLHKSNLSNLKAKSKKDNKTSDKSFQVLENEDVGMFWQLVSENSLPLSYTEEIHSNRISSSLQSLIQKDVSDTSVNTSISKMTNIKKGSRNRPRRKFSILRERFEPRCNSNSDEEILYRSFENISHTLNSNNVNIKKQLDLKTDKLKLNLQQNNEEMKSCDVINKSVINPLDMAVSKNVKDKRSLFMKQVLSPPKFNTKLRHKV